MPRLTTIVAIGLLFIVGAAQVRAESGRIYGKLYTVDNDVFEGWIRWDKNEAYWDDILDGTVEKDRKEANRRQGKRYYKESKNYAVDVFGIKIGEGNNVFGLDFGSESQLQFGNMRTLARDRDDGATITLKNGEVVIFASGSDLGPSMREIMIYDAKEGEIYFDWDDIDHIDFMQEASEPTDGMERLYGRVSTRRAGEFTGWIEWDVDEVFNEDEIDGDEEGGRTRKINLGRISSIERRSSSSASLILKDGKEMVLRNSNDVNSENRGIVVKSPEFGRVKIAWSDFEKAEFLPVPKAELPSYKDFDGGHPIRGSVTTEDGEEFSGSIAWDNDEEYTWEHLNGEYKGVEMVIPFSIISSIEKSSQRSASVTLKNGDTYILSGSNDVNEENKGIFVAGEKNKSEQIDWYDFAKLVIR